MSRRRRYFSIFLKSIALLLLVVAASLVVLHLPATQRWLTPKLEQRLAEKLGTELQIAGVGVVFPSGLEINGLIINTPEGDSLLRVGSLGVGLDMWALLQRQIVVQSFSLENASVWLQQKGDSSNYDFILAAFAPIDADENPAPSEGFQLRLDGATLHMADVRFRWEVDRQPYMAADIGNLSLRLAATDWEKTYFEVVDFSLANSFLAYREPATTSSSESDASSVLDIQIQQATIADSRLYFATSTTELETKLPHADLSQLALTLGERGIGLSVKEVALTDSDLSLRQAETIPTPGRFNAGDMDWKNLNGRFHSVSLDNDTISLDIGSLAGAEHSGIHIHQLTGGVAYSPAAIALDKLDLQANETQIRGDFNLLFGQEGQSPIAGFSFDVAHAAGKVADLLKWLPPNPEIEDWAQMAEAHWALKGRLHGDMEELTAQDVDFQFGHHTQLHGAGHLVHFTDLQRIGGQFNISALQFDKDDFSPLLAGKNWTLPAYAQLSGRMAGRAGALDWALRGSLGNLDTLAFAPAVADTIYIDLTGHAAGLATAQDLRFHVNIRRLEAAGVALSRLAPSSIPLPDLLGATGTLGGSLAQMDADLQWAWQRDGHTSTLATAGKLFQVNDADRLGFDLSYSGDISRHELAAFLPDSILNRYTHLPDVLALEGTAKGTPSDVTAQALVALGEQGSISVTGSLVGEKYEASIVGNNLKINTLATSSQLADLDNLGLSLNIEGQGFGIGKTATAQISGGLTALVWGGKTIQDITLAGNLNASQFDLQINSPDPSLAWALSATGDVDDKHPQVDWTLEVGYFDFHALGLSEKTVVARFNMEGTAQGNSLDTLDASISLYDIDIQYDSLHLTPANTTIMAALHDGENTLSLQSDWLAAELDGHFDIAQLPQWAEELAQHYFRTAPDKSPALAPPNENTDHLAFNFWLKDPAWLTGGIVPGLSALGEAKGSGTFDAQRQIFDLTADLTAIDYEGWALDGLAFSANGDGTTAQYALSIPMVAHQNATIARNLNLTGTLDGKRANALLAAQDSLGDTRFQMGVYADAANTADGFTLHFLPTQTIDYQEWAIDADNSVALTGQRIAIQQLNLTNAEQSVRLDGTSVLLDDGQRTLDFTLAMRQLKLDNLKVFLLGVLDNPTGTLDGDLTLAGTTTNIIPSGQVSLQGVAATIPLTGVHYKISDKALAFESKGIDLSGLSLTDPQQGKLTLDGWLRTDNWSDWQYDLGLSSAKLQVLDTRQQPDQAYYGQLYASVTGTVRGPLAQPDIRLTVKTLGGSKLHYTYDAAVGGEYGDGLVVFVGKDSPSTAANNRTLSSQKYPFHLDMNLEINDSLQLHVVTDPGTGDAFEGQLDGRLSLEIFPDGKMNLAGRCDVKSGTYRYSYQQVVRRDFQVSPSSYLAWTGDPFNPDINLTARYVVRTSPYPLLAATGTPSDAADARSFQTFFLNFIVKGDAAQPEVTFALEYPDELEGYDNLQNSGNPAISDAVARVNQDPPLLYQQLFGLLVFKGFWGDGGGSTTPASSLNTSIGNILSNQFNALAGQYVKFVDIQMNVEEDVTFGDGDQSTGTTNYNLQVQKSFLNNRLVFRVTGGTASERSGEDSEWRGTLENAYVEYLLTPDGSIKLRALSENGLEILDGKGGRNTAAGVVFTKEFSSWRRKRK